MRLDEARTQAPPPVQAKVDEKEKISAGDNRKHVTVPVLGLASCGVSGWYNPGRLAIRVPIPITHPNAENFIAVIAVGMSMQPNGIRQGYLLLCDAAATPQKGDAVFVRQHNERVSIKKYMAEDDKWIYLQG